jgi:secreted Zn-dependent insulinase-like peptidase
MLFRPWLIGLFLIIVQIGCVHQLEQIFRSDAKDGRQTRVRKRHISNLILDNDMEIILISDPNFNKSAMAIDVNVGWGQDPDDQAGMAHFLEHMLFLGTEKYPAVGEFGEYVRSHQGSFNAMTTFENTNYHFEIQHSRFEEGLDRFAQFFIAPQFNKDFVEREKNAVHEEFQLEKHKDDTRRYELQKLEYKPEHSARRFATGNLQTLKSVNRQDLIRWYQKHYSANLMTGVMMSPLSLETMEQLAQTYLGSIQNRQRKRADYESVMNIKRKPKVIHARPMQKEDVLHITFHLPPQFRDYQAKSVAFISRFFRLEHQGSLIQRLKAQGLIQALHVETWRQRSGYEFTVSLDLTEQGRRRYRDVIDQVFAYSRFLAAQGLPEWYFRQRQTMTQAYFRYPEFQEGGNYAAYLAGRMQLLGGHDLIKKIKLYSNYDPQGFKELAGLFNVERAQIIFFHDDFKRDRVDPLYGTEYKFEPITASHRRGIQQASMEGFKYPEPNPYLPTSLALVSASSQTKPYQLAKTPSGELWFQADQTLQLPRAEISGTLVGPSYGQNPSESVKFELLAEIASYLLQSWQLQLAEAGMDLDVSPSGYGLSFTLNGFSDKIVKAFDDFNQKLADLSPTEADFQLVKRRTMQNFASFRSKSAYGQALIKLEAELYPDLIYPVDGLEELKNIQYKEFQAFWKEFVDRYYMQIVAYGNLQPQRLKAVFAKVKTRVEPHSIQALTRRYQLSDVIKQRKFVIESKGNNYAWAGFFHGGAGGPEDRAFMRLVDAYLAKKFFHHIRTRQQLGYVAFNMNALGDDYSGLELMIQSSRFSPALLEKRSLAWLSQQAKLVDELTDSDWATIKKGVLATLRELPKSCAEFANHLQSEVFPRHQLGLREKVTAQVENMSLSEFRKRFRMMAQRTQPTLSVHVQKRVTR